MLKRVLKSFCLCGVLIAGFANAEDAARNIWFWDDNSAAPNEILDSNMTQQELGFFDD